MIMESLYSPVLNCEDVRKLIDKRCHLPSRSYVTIKGCVTSMSEIMRMKQEDFFLLELDHQVYVLVKDYYLEWHSQLCPLTTVVFYNLRLTTIERGVANPQPILIAWKTSRITLEPESKDISFADFKKWLADTELALPTADSEYDKCQSVTSAEKCHHFQGTVTDTSQSDDGFYILDGKIRLFTGLVPCDGFDAGVITEGCSLQIYNVHSLQDPENTFVACSRSLIRCNVHNSLRGSKGSHNSSKKMCAGCPVNSIIHKYALNFNEAQVVLALQQHIGGTRGKNLPKILDNILRSEVCGNIATAGLSPIDLFIHHDRLCQMLDNHLSRNRIPALQSVQQLKDLFRKENNETAQETLGSDERPSHWSFCQLTEDRKILLGTLRVSKVGQLEFVDTTGEIPVVLFNDRINEDNDNSEDLPSSCEKNDSKQKRNEMTCHCCGFRCLRVVRSKENPFCPLISQGFVGKTLIVQRFHLISEQFNRLSHNEGSLFDSHSHISEIKSSATDVPFDICSLTYLLVHFQDCLMLEHSFSKPSKTVDCENFKSYCSRNQAKPLSRFVSYKDEYASCLIHVSGKECMMASGLLGHHFKMNGTLINLDDWEEFVVESKYQGDIQSMRSSCGTNCEGKYLHERKRLVDFEDSKTLSNGAEAKKGKCNLLHSSLGTIQEVQKEDRGQRNGNDAFASNEDLSQSAIKHVSQRAPGSNKNVCSLFHDTKPVTLFITGEALSSYPFLSSQKFYMLNIHVNKEDAEVGAFNPVFSNGNVEQTLLRSNSRIFIDVKEKLGIEKAVMKAYSSEIDITSFGLEMYQLQTVVDALKPSDTESLVSFRCVIIAREALTPTFALKGSSGSDDIKLIVRDLSDSSFHMHVYFKSFKACDVLGLIPGVLVDFHGVERKVSQQGNVYCKFGATSSFFVQRSIEGCNSGSVGTNARLKNSRVDSLPREYLFNIWHLNANNCVESRLQWSVKCHICMIFKLCLKVVCSLCQGLYLKSGCQSRGCKNTDSFHVRVQAVALVDDGTCQASIKFFIQKQVQRLLTLTDEQWSDLISEVQKSGEIVVSRFEPSESCLPIEKFLCQLIQSPLVIRTCFMTVRYVKNSPNSSTVAKMNLHDFKVKDTKFGKSTVPVLQLPLMQMECVELREAPK